MRDPQSERIIMDKLIKMDANWGVQSAFSIIFIHDSLKPTILTPKKHKKTSPVPVPWPVHPTGFGWCPIAWRPSAPPGWASWSRWWCRSTAPRWPRRCRWSSLGGRGRGMGPAWGPAGSKNRWHISDFNRGIWGKSGKNMEQKKLTVNDHDISLVWNFWMNF